MVQQSLKKNSIFNAVKTVSSIIFPLITFPYVSRVLQPENIGKINFSISIISYFSLAASLGITTYAIRECSMVRSDKGKLNDTASQIFSINVITTFLAYAALFITLLTYHKLDNYRVLIIIQSLTIAAAAFGADWINAAMEDYKYITARTLMFQVISLILMFVFIHKPEDYIKYALISLISSAGASVLNIWYRKRYCRIVFIWHFIRGIEWKKHMKPIILLAVMILAQTLFNSVDVTMLGLMHGDREVGIYSTAYKLANVVAQLIVSFAWVVMPRMANYYGENNYTEINKLLKKIMGYFALFGLPCIIGTICISQEIISIIAGKSYMTAVPVLQILMLGFVFDLFGNSFLGNIVCLPLKQEKKYTMVWIFSSLLNIGLNYVLIPRFGALAAAGTTAFSYLASLIILVILLDKKIRIESKRQQLLSPILGCAGIVLVCRLAEGIPMLAARTGIKIGLSVIAYAAIQWIMKNQQFMETIQSIRKKIQE